jgi:ribosomal protein S18 acetylase RimI-like enzyme
MPPVTTADIRIGPDDSAEARHAAAGIWAHATAQRDNREPASIETTLPGIQHRLTAEAGSLHIARLHGAVVGFVLLVARATVLEVVYLAVAPESWGAGIARRLLTYVDRRARAAGISSLDLWVIDDNTRAVRVYERSGWRSTEDLKVRSSAGRTERRLVRELDSRTG